MNFEHLKLAVFRHSRECGIVVETLGASPGPPLSRGRRLRRRSDTARMRTPRNLPLLATMLVAIATLFPAANVCAEPQAVRIGWLSQEVKRTLPPPISTSRPRTKGYRARGWIADNDTTGHFTGQSFELVERVVPEDGDVAASSRLVAKGVHLVVTDLAAPELLSSQISPKRDSDDLDTAAADDRLRGEDCRANLFIFCRAGRCLPMRSSNILSSSAGPISFGRRPWRGRSRIRRRHPPCRAEVSGPHR